MDKVDHDRLVEINNEISNLLDEAFSLIPKGHQRDRAKAYWYGSIKTNLSRNHDFLASSMCTMEDTINALDPGEDSEDEEFEKDGESVRE